MNIGYTQRTITLQQNDQGEYQWRCDDGATSPPFKHKGQAITYGERMPLMTDSEWEEAEQ